MRLITLLAMLAPLWAAPALADDPGPDPVPFSHSYAPPVPGTYGLPSIKPAADGPILDEAGARRTLHAVYDGRITVLSFIYGACNDPHGCPLALVTMKQLSGALADDAALRGRVQIVTLSFDPERDTPKAMAQMSQHIEAAETPDVPWHFLTTENEAAVEPILDAYGQSLIRDVDAATGDIAHLLRAYLIDARGRIRNIYGLDYLYVPVLMADIRTLAMEGSAGQDAEQRDVLPSADAPPARSGRLH